MVAVTGGRAPHDPYQSSFNYVIPICGELHHQLSIKKSKFPGLPLPTELRTTLNRIKFAKRDLRQSIMGLGSSPHEGLILAGLSDKTKPSDIP